MYYNHLLTPVSAHSLSSSYREQDLHKDLVMLAFMIFPLPPQGVINNTTKFWFFTFIFSYLFFSVKPVPIPC